VLKIDLRPAPSPLYTSTVGSMSDEEVREEWYERAVEGIQLVDCHGHSMKLGVQNEPIP
jgi:hypothetical protein